MRCRDAQRIISECLDGPVAEQHRGAMEKHLAGCAACQRYMRRMQSLEKALTAPPLVNPPHAFTERVMARLREQQPAPRPVTTSGGTQSHSARVSMSNWLGLALLGGWLWLSGLLLIGVALFSVAGGWQMVAHAWAGSSVERFFSIIGSAVSFAAVAGWQAGAEAFHSVGAPIVVSSIGLALMLCFVWFRLLQRYQWQAG